MCRPGIFVIWGYRVAGGLTLLNSTHYLRKTKGWAIAQTFLFLLVFAFSSPAEAACPWFAQLGRYLVPAKRIASDEAYASAKTYWETTLSGKTAPSLEFVLAKLKERGDGSPETLMALMDTLSPGGTVTFKEWMRRLDEDGITVRFRDSGDDGTMQRRDDLKWKWSLSKALPPLQRKASVLQIDLPDTPPESAKDLLSRIYALSVALPGAQLEVKARRAPLLSFPVGNSKWAYPAQLREAVRNVEERVYASLHQWEKLWGEPPLELTEKGTGPWHGSYATLPLLLAWRSIFPFYDPVKRYKPTKTGYERFKQGQGGVTGIYGKSPHDNYVRDRYQMRGTEKWVVDQYMRALKVTGAWAMVTGIIKLAIMASDGTLEAMKEANERFWGSLTDTEKLNEGLANYENNKEGDPLVNAEYAPLIKAVEDEIKAKGDRDGKLKEKRDKLISERNFLRN